MKCDYTIDRHLSAFSEKVSFVVTLRFMPSLVFIRNLFIISWFVLLPSSLALASSQFSLQGTLIYQVRNHPALHRDFTVSVSNCLWQITVVLKEKSPFESFVFDFDGTNIIQYQTFKNSGPEVGSGFIQAAPVCSYSSFSGGEAVWLAYGSACYFQNQKAGAAMSMENLRSTEGHAKRYEMSADWSLSAHEPFLPSQINYYQTNIARLDENGDLVSLPLPDGFPQKYRIIGLNTWDRTLTSGLSVPRAFEFFMCGPIEMEGSRMVIGTNLTVRGQVTNVCALIPFLTLPSTLNLEDFRPLEPKLVYPVTNGILPSLDSGYLTTRIQAAKERNAMLREGTRLKTAASGTAVRQHRTIIQITFLFLVIVPFAVIGFRKIGRLRDTNRKP